MAEALPIFELGLVLLLAALAGTAARRLGLPAVVGYLAVGLLVGPFTPGYVADPERIRVLANVGVVLLLFEVGIEIDVRAVRRDPRGLLIAAPLQVLVVWLLSAVAAALLGLAAPGAATIGLAVALSSSVVIVNMTRSRRRTVDAPTARAMVVWAVLQDVVSLFAVAGLSVLLFSEDAAELGIAVGKLVVFVAVALAIGMAFVPAVLRRVRDEHDTLLIVAVSIALVTAGLGAVLFDVPLALAAFVAGLAISSRPEAREARREVHPFRDLFAVMFFVAVGTLVDPNALASTPIGIAVLGLVVLKGLVVWGLSATFRVRADHRQLGIALAQIGEFSFVVLALGLAAGAITAEQFSATLAASVITIAVSTIAVRSFPRLEHHEAETADAAHAGHAGT